MRKIPLSLFTIFILSACNSSEKTSSSATAMAPSDLVIENLKGEVSSYEDTPYKTDSTGKVGDMDSCCVTVSEYDENGNGTTSTSKDSKGVVKTHGVITRHPNGMFKSITNREKGKTSSFDTKVDDKGNYSWGESIDTNGKMERYYLDIKQDENKNVIGWKEYDKDSVLRQSGEGHYDKYLQTSFTVKDSVGKVKSSSAYKYNEKGEQIEASNTTITKDSTTTKVTKYTYDSHDEMGNWTQRTTWDDKGKATAITKRTYTYRKK